MHDSVLEGNGGKLDFQKLGPDPDIPLFSWTQIWGLYNR